MSTFVAWRAMHLVAFCLLGACLSGCDIYRYQPNVVAVPMTDTAGKVAVSAAVGLGGFKLPHYAAQVQLSPINHLTLGGQAGYYSKHDPTIEQGRGLFFYRSTTYYDYWRRGHTVGLNIGTYAPVGRCILFLQGGADREAVYASFRHSESPPTNSTQRDIYDRQERTYLKPWVQLGGRYRPLNSGEMYPLQITITHQFAARLSAFVQQADILNRFYISTETGKPLSIRSSHEPHYALDLMYGVEFRYRGLAGILRFQYNPSSALNDLWYTPGLSANLGLGYVLRLWRARQPVY